MLKLMISWIWQLPQNLLGLLLSRRCKFKSVRYVDIERDIWVMVYFRSFFGSGISLGRFIILDYYKYLGQRERLTTKHEYGHQRQSRMLGWLYLPLIGIPSLLRNIWDRIFHRKWSSEDRSRWYYGGFPENWADHLGGVIRT